MQYFQKLIQKDLGFTHTLVESLPSHDRADVWALHRGKSKENGEPSLVFHFDPSKARVNFDRNQRLAKTGLMRLKTLRHPDVLKFLTSVEGSDGTIYLATEPATPLAALLSNDFSKPDHESIQWGLFTISRALGFMHSSGLIHGRINPSTIFVTPSGDWKLGGLECVTPHGSAPSLAQHATALQSSPYQSPEFSNANWSSVASAAPSAVDSWALGCLMYEVHAGSLSSPDQLQNTIVLPKSLLSAYQKLLASNPSARAPAGQIPNHPYFKNSKFVELNMFVDNLALKGQLEREAFLGKLTNTMDRLPDRFCTHKILPMLSQSMETGVGGNAAFACIVKMKDRLNNEDFANNIARKYALSWFSNNNIDRNLRVELYNNLNMFTCHLDDSAINTTVFPAMCTSFQDMQAPALRDAAVKSVLCVCDRLSDKNLNTVLMSHFARLQVDPEPAIRTNTTVCLGKVAPKLSQTAKNKVLAAAFIRSLKDPFPPARSAGLSAILATTDTYAVKDMATRLLPTVVSLLVDLSGDVRKLAFQVLTDFQSRLFKNHEEMLLAEASVATQQNGRESSVSAGGGASTQGASGWSLSSFSSMTAALLHKSDSTPNTTALPSKSTGISSENFHRVISSNSVDSAGPKAMAAPGKRSTASSSANDIWGVANGSKCLNVPSSSLPPTGRNAATTPVTSVSSQNTNDNNSHFNNDFGGDDDDEDGWGDMDIKPEAKLSNDEDILASFLGQPAAKIETFPTGRKGGKKLEERREKDDLWDLTPPLIRQPKPKLTQRPGGAHGVGVGNSTLGNKGPGRRAASADGGSDDWEALLGGLGSSSKRRVAGRGAGMR